MIETVRHGRSGTAMMAFTGRLDEDEIAAIVDYVREAFMREHAPNTRYHIPENGWVDHERYRDAFPFVSGEIPLDRPWQALTPAQRRGRRLFMSACITCHEHPGKAVDWDASAVSYPRGGYDHRKERSSPDAVSQATPYALHERPPVLIDASPEERLGERLFQGNCAFCHAADGTGKGWIGRFLLPHPRDLTDRQALAGRTREDLRRVIRNGLPGTTMSAWRDVLDDSQIDAIIAYINRVFQPLPVAPVVSLAGPAPHARGAARDSRAGGSSVRAGWRRHLAH